MDSREGLDKAILMALQTLAGSSSIPDTILSSIRRVKSFLTLSTELASFIDALEKMVYALASATTTLEKTLQEEMSTLVEYLRSIEN